MVVGTATFPAIGYSSIIASHPSMGTGALVSSAVEPPAWRRVKTSPDPILNGPQYVFVRLAKGVSAERGLADLQHIAAAANKPSTPTPSAAGNDGVSVDGVERPAQIVNYRTIGATPLVLAAGLAAGAVLALGLTLTASVRRRRRDLALLKDPRVHPEAACVRPSPGNRPSPPSLASWWGRLSASSSGASSGSCSPTTSRPYPDPTTPALSVSLVALGALVFANLVAALPGRTAARTPTGLLLRAE